MLSIIRDLVKVLQLLDNAPVHPVKPYWVGDNGRIRCIFLPTNMIPLIQSKGQGMIVAMKRLYQQWSLEEITVVLEEEQGLDMRGQHTLENLRKYSIKSALYS